MCSEPFHLDCFICKRYAHNQPEVIPHDIKNNSVVTNYTGILINRLEFIEICEVGF